MGKIICMLTIYVTLSVLVACASKPPAKEENSAYNTTQETATALEDPDVVRANVDLFIQTFNANESAATGAAQRLYRAGCGRILHVADVIEYDKAYSMTVTDEKGDTYKITISDEGYLGTVVDKDGNYLVVPVDD